MNSTLATLSLQRSVVTMRRLVGVVAGCSFIFQLGTMLPAQIYKVVATYKLPAASARGIAVDSSARRVFVADGDAIAVLDADTGAASGSIGGLKGAQDVLLIPAMSGDAPAPSTKGYASDAAGRVVAFTLADLKMTA